MVSPLHFTPSQFYIFLFSPLPHSPHSTLYLRFLSLFSHLSSHAYIPHSHSPFSRLSSVPVPALVGSAAVSVGLPTPAPVGGHLDGSWDPATAPSLYSLSVSIPIQQFWGSVYHAPPLPMFFVLLYHVIIPIFFINIFSDITRARS